MKLYRRDSETFFVRSDNRVVWELFKDLAPMLFTPGMTELPLVKELIERARPCEWDDLPRWAKNQIAELVEEGFLPEEPT